MTKSGVIEGLGSSDVTQDFRGSRESQHRSLVGTMVQLILIVPGRFLTCWLVAAAILFSAPQYWKRDREGVGLDSVHEKIGTISTARSSENIADGEVVNTEGSKLKASSTGSSVPFNHFFRLKLGHGHSSSSFTVL